MERRTRGPAADVVSFRWERAPLNGGIRPAAGTPIDPGAPRLRQVAG